MSVPIAEESIRIPAGARSVSIRRHEAAFIFRFLRERGIRRTLEVGFAYGYSAAQIVAATESTHVVIDPFQSHYDGLGIRNLEGLGFGELLEFHEDSSSSVLPRLLSQGRSFEFAFVDGDHKFDNILVDFFYVDKLLERGGWVLFDDTWMRTTRLVVSFIRRNRVDYTEERTPCRNFALFRKTGEDRREWNHFREFYTWRSIISHPLIRWLCHGKDSSLKRFLRDVGRRLRRRSRGEAADA